MTVIILSRPGDYHVSLVAKHLGHQPLVLDVQNIIDGSGFTYTFTEGEISVWHQGMKLDNVTGVWIRRPRNIHKQVALAVDEQYRGYASSALSRLLYAMGSCLPEAIWVSDPYAIQRAENKPFQQVVAHAIGFNVPDTIYTSDHFRAKEFVSNRLRSVVKPLGTDFPVIDERAVFAFGTKIVSSDIKYDGLNLAPAIFQEAIEPTREFRVTVVGDEVFSTSVGTARKFEITGLRDSRPIPGESGDVQFVQSHELPEELERKCARLVRELGLVYGAIDLIEDQDGQVWFLEVNPTGQWAFVEERTGLPISAALAKVLEGKQ